MNLTPTLIFPPRSLKYCNYSHLIIYRTTTFFQTTWKFTCMLRNLPTVLSPSSTLNMVLVRCSVGFSEEIIAIFQMIKISNWHRKWQNSQNFPFSKFLRTFCQIVDRLRGLECFKASKGKVLVVQWWSFSKSLLRFSKWKCLRVTAKMTKIPKFPIFQRFYAIFHFFDGLCRLDRWKGSTRKECVVQFVYKRDKCSFSN